MKELLIEKNDKLTFISFKHVFLRIISINIIKLQKNIENNH